MQITTTDPKGTVASRPSNSTSKTADSSEHSVEQEATVTCSKCKTTTPWGASSWCPDCGYYPGVTDAVPEQEHVAEDTHAVPAIAKPAPLLPVWLVQVIAFPTIILVASMATRFYFTYYSGPRGIVSLSLFAIGLLAAFVAHIRASIVAMKETPSLGPADVVASPLEMWRPTFRQLPESGNRIVMFVCGATAVLSALVIIGGLDFGSLLKRDKVKVDKDKKNIVRAVAESGWIKDEDEEAEEETLEESLDPSKMPAPAELADQLPPADQPLRCVVYGYMKDGKEDFGRLLLAAKINGVGVHVGVINGSDLSQRMRAQLAQRLSNIETDKPAVKPKYHGTFVRPKIGLRINFTGWSMTGELMNPEIDFGGSKGKKS